MVHVVLHSVWKKNSNKLRKEHTWYGEFLKAKPKQSLLNNSNCGFIFLI
jgi:hypothetical protein